MGDSCEVSCFRPQSITTTVSVKKLTIIFKALYADNFYYITDYSLIIYFPQVSKVIIYKGCFMKIVYKLTAVVMSFTLLVSAHASLIKIETGFSAARQQTDAAAYKSLVNTAVASPSAGYGTTFVTSYDNISNRNLFPSGSKTDIAFKATIGFYVSAENAGSWQFRIGVDFGHGGAIFVDDVAYDFKTNDMWWNGSYKNSSQYFSINSLNLATGNHTLNLYGLEGCCDGYQQAQFSVGSGDFTTFNTSDNLTPVPEPEIYTLMLAGLGLIWCIAYRRKESIT